MSKVLLFASANLDKIAEVQLLFEQALPGRYEIKGYLDVVPEVGEIEETGLQLLDNATIKAEAIFSASEQSVFADDTGLEVAALGGAPGVRSARYAGENVTYADNVKKLLSEMESKLMRDARFRTIIAYIDANGGRYYFEGVSEGIITNSEQGSGGFGYDPIFSPMEFPGQTFAEMPIEQKNKISHRGRALQMFIDFLAKTTV